MMFKLPEFILSKTNKESCPFVVNIFKEYFLGYTVESVTRNTVLKTVDPKNHEKKSQRSHFRPKKISIPNVIEMGEGLRCNTPSSILIVDRFGCGKTCFKESLLLDHFEEFGL